MTKDQFPINSQEARLLISELQSRVEFLGGAVSNLQGQVSKIPLNPNDTGATPQAVNQIYNGSFSHSVNSWEDSVAADNGRYECAWFYSHPIQTGQAMFKNNSLAGGAGQATLTLGVVDSGAETITITSHGLQTGTACTLSGSIPAPLAAGTVYYVIRVDANTIQVAASYADAVAGTEINLTSTTTGGTLSYNYTLKDDSSTTYSVAFSDWDIPTGTARFNPDFDISCFLPGNNIEAGYPYYAAFSIAKASQYIYAQSDVRIFAGLYSYSTAGTSWDWIGGDFEVTAEVLGTVATPTSREYRVLAETNRGFSVLSSTLTVASAPSDTDFTNGARVFLSWPRVLNYGITSYSIYRNTGGTYRLLQTISSGLQQYIDNNGFQSTAVGWPSADFNRLVAYTATGDNVVATLPYEGSPLNEGWAVLPFALKVPTNYDKTDTDLDKGQWLRVGLNGQLDLRVTNCEINVPVPGTIEIVSTAGQFTSDLVGLTIIVTKKGYENTTTVSAYTDPNTIEVNLPLPDFADGDIVTVVIVEGAPAHALSVDLMHLTYISGAGFSPNAEDISADRGIPAATPNGTTQDGPPLGQPPGDGDGYPVDTCLYEFEMVESENGEIPAIDLAIGMRLPNGHGGFNEINSVKRGVNDVYYIETENGCSLLATPTKKIFVTKEEKRALDFLMEGDEIMTSIDGQLEPSRIAIKHLAKKRVVVVQIGLTPEHSFLAGSGKGRILVSNEKDRDPIILV